MNNLQLKIQKHQKVLKTYNTEIEVDLELEKLANFRLSS